MSAISMFGAEQTQSGSLSARKVLMIVENLPVPFDRRVWQEARALRDAGAEVSIICPVGIGAEDAHHPEPALPARDYV